MVRKVATPARSSVVTLDPAPARPKKRSSGDLVSAAAPGATAAFSPTLPLFCFAVPTAAIFPLARFRNYGMVTRRWQWGLRDSSHLPGAYRGLANDRRPISARSAHAVGPCDDRARRGQGCPAAPFDRSFRRWRR